MIKKRYYRRRHYGKPLPAKRDIKAHLQFFQLVKEAGENDENNKTRSKVSNDDTNGRTKNKNG